MKYFPIFLKLENKRVIVLGGGETAMAKLRLLMKTEAKIEVYATEPSDEIRTWAQSGRLILIEREAVAEDIGDAISIYIAYETNEDNLNALSVCEGHRALVNMVDTPAHCDFITPAIVDRDPLVVAIGSEGVAPVLGRKIKAKLEADLPADTGAVLRVARGFREKVAHWSSKRRRLFWSAFYENMPKAEDAHEKLEALLDADAQSHYATQGSVSFVGAGPGDPELLTLKARKAIDKADVILHDRLVSSEILELARREAVLIEVGKKGFGPSWTQSDINALMIKHAKAGAHVIRLKSGDPVIYGRLDEETEALDDASISYEVVPGVSAANAAAASLKLSLTKRGRNSEIRYLTGHDMNGFAEHDWRALAKDGQCAAIYMGAQQASILRGRLLMHGASAETPILAIENVSRPDQKVLQTTLLNFPEAIDAAQPQGPVVILFGISAQKSAQSALSFELSQFKEAVL